MERLASFTMAAVEEPLSLSELRERRPHRALRRILWTALGFSLLPFSQGGGVFELSRHQIKIPKLMASLRVMQLSDFHFNHYLRKKHVERWFDLATQEQVDIILLTGDFFDYLSSHNRGFFFDQLARLNAPLGVWAVWGNHDYDSQKDTLERLKQQLREVNVAVLVNEGRYVQDDLFLAGIDDAREGHPDINKALQDYQKDSVCLLMSHVPDVIPLIPKHVDMTFCGHTHGGQVVLPFIGITKTSSYYGKQFAKGYISEPNKAYISRGLGYSTIPVRLNCPGEIAIFELLPDDSQTTDLSSAKLDP